MRDMRGTELEEGQRVAYNRSGDVIPGVIVRLPRRGRSGRRVSGSIYVEPSHGVRANYSGAPSRVKHSRSVLVLLDDEA